MFEVLVTPRAAAFWVDWRPFIWTVSMFRISELQQSILACTMDVEIICRCSFEVNHKADSAKATDKREAKEGKLSDVIREAQIQIDALIPVLI